MSFFGLFGDSTDSINKEIEAENKRHQDAMTSLNERKTKALTASSNSGSFSVFSPGSWFGSSSTPSTSTTTTNPPNQMGGGKKKKKAKSKKNMVKQQQQQMISFTSGYTIGGGKKKKRRVRTIKKRKQ